MSLDVGRKKIIQNLPINTRFLKKKIIKHVYSWEDSKYIVAYNIGLTHVTALFRHLSTYSSLAHVHPVSYTASLTLSGINLHLNY